MFKMPTIRHLGFLEIETFTIGSAIPEKPTAEPNTLSPSRTERELWEFKHLKKDGSRSPSQILILINGFSGHPRRRSDWWS